MAADYVAAWKAFQQSEKFRKWTDGSTIHLPPDMRKYLGNRILAAFEHGWNMHLAASSQEPCHECGGDRISRQSEAAFATKQPCTSCVPETSEDSTRAVLRR